MIFLNNDMGINHQNGITLFYEVRRPYSLTNNISNKPNLKKLRPTRMKGMVIC